MATWAMHTWAMHTGRAKPWRALARVDEAGEPAPIGVAQRLC
jgi:hypothetical protein